MGLSRKLRAGDVPRTVKLHKRGGKVDLLKRGDVIFFPGGRVKIDKTGANGGLVRVVITADDGTFYKVVKQRRKIRGTN